MKEYQQKFWELRLEACAEACDKNNFDVFIAQSRSHAADIFTADILPGMDISTASLGDSMSLAATGIVDILKSATDVSFLNTFEQGVDRETIIERRRQALLVDLFVTGSNAITEKGQLVNLDMVGNRVGGLTFGPRYVVLVIGRNKLVADIESAMERIKSIAAPLNAARHEGWRTPCVKTATCMDCKSPDRICNTWVITEKSYPKGRIKIILVNEDLGL